MSAKQAYRSSSEAQLCVCGCGETAPFGSRGRPLRLIAGHRLPRRPIETLYRVNPNTDCWEWTAYVDPCGYARYGRDLGHRVMYERHVGPIPVDKQIDHLCRNRKCVNPDHLEAVTPAVNTWRGVATKLSNEEVRQIKAAPAEVSNTELARRHGVSQPHICDIRSGKRRVLA